MATAKKKEAPKSEPKPEATKAPETKAVAAAPQAALPAIQGASERIQNALAEVSDNLKSVENYRLPRAKLTSEGFELAEGEEPVEELEGILIHAKKTNVYYDKPYNPSDVTPPTCFSLDGDKPDKSIQKPVHATCKGCPMAEFGTNSMKSGKACRNLKPLFLIRQGEDGISIIPRQITITPTSLKSANQYLMDLTERGIAYRKVLTKITTYKENAKDTYRKMKFSIAKRLDAQDLADVEVLRKQWLPIMDAQNVDQNEVDSGAGAAVVAEASGEY